MTLTEIRGGTRAVTLTPEELDRQARNVGADPAVREELTGIGESAIDPSTNAIRRELAIARGTPHDLTDQYAVPTDAAFAGIGDWLPGDDLAKTAAKLINRHRERFGHVLRFTIAYRWKRHGGRALGMCERWAGSKQAIAPGVDFLIWLGAENCRNGKFTAYQVEALLFHEMLHIGISGKGKPALNQHDRELFAAEVTEYGLWEPGLQFVGEAFAALRDEGAGDDGDEDDSDLDEDDSDLDEDDTE